MFRTKHDVPGICHRSSGFPLVSDDDDDNAETNSTSICAKCIPYRWQGNHDYETCWVKSPHIVGSRKAISMSIKHSQSVSLIRSICSILFQDFRFFSEWDFFYSISLHIEESVLCDDTLNGVIRTVLILFYLFPFLARPLNSFHSH